MRGPRKPLVSNAATWVRTLPSPCVAEEDDAEQEQDKRKSLAPEVRLSEEQCAEDERDRDREAAQERAGGNRYVGEGQAP